MTEDGRQAAEAILDGLDEPRRSQMRHLHVVILEALPGIDVGVWDYRGDLIGYGAFDYSTSKGPAGRWFSIGIANRKNFISLYSMASGERGYLIEEIRDRFPGTKVGKSCINITKPEQLDDEAVRDLARVSWGEFKEGFRRPM